jgi:hypothetical protein
MLVAGCAQEVDGDVTGPFTGTPRRYVIDSFTLPTNNTEARALGADLDGDTYPDNQLGSALSFLGNQGDVTTHGSDMLASGAIASTIVVRANDYWDDDTVSVIYYGSDGDPADPVGGRFEASLFTSNRAATTTLNGTAIARLPIFVDAAPSDVPLFGLQMTLEPDGTGFVAAIQGLIGGDDALALTYEGLSRLVAAEPDSHRMLMLLLDTNKDWNLSYEEVATNSVIASLMSPDVTLDGVEGLALGFRAHLSPCDAGSCIEAPPADACHDRVKDGDESDVDCGGACRSCKSGEQCSGAADCESGACDAGACRAPTCSDGVRDGFETDVDCGGACGGCALDARCFSGADCASTQCGEPCTSPDPFGCVDLSPDFETCRPMPPP